MNKHVFKIISEMKNSKIKNYIVPGLSSSLIGGGDFGKVRLFEASRTQFEFITPHSHRFDFACFVLRGTVENTSWIRCDTDDGEYYQLSLLNFNKPFGHYTLEEGGKFYYYTNRQTIYSDNWYFMNHKDFHSVKFSRDAVVLFFEGPEKLDHSFILEPVVNGKKVSTFHIRDWMFMR